MGFIKDMKNKAVKKMMIAQMKKQGADDTQISLITELIEKDPDLFENMGKEIEARTKDGVDQTVAAQEVMIKYQADFQKIMMKNPAMMQKMKLEAMKMQRKSK